MTEEERKLPFNRKEALESMLKSKEENYEQVCLHKNLLEGEICTVQKLLKELENGKNEEKI